MEYKKSNGQFSPLKSFKEEPMHSKDREPVIVQSCRTPIGKFLGALSSLSAPDLGALVVENLIAKAGVEPQCFDEVIMGNVVGTGVGQAPARQASVRGGIPPQARNAGWECGSWSLQESEPFRCH